MNSNTKIDLGDMVIVAVRDFYDQNTTIGTFEATCTGIRRMGHRDYFIFSGKDVFASFIRDEGVCDVETP